MGVYFALGGRRESVPSFGSDRRYLPVQIYSAKRSLDHGSTTTRTSEHGRQYRRSVPWLVLMLASNIFVYYLNYCQHTYVKQWLTFT